MMFLRSIWTRTRARQSSSVLGREVLSFTHEGPDGRTRSRFRLPQRTSPTAKTPGPRERPVRRGKVILRQVLQSYPWPGNIRELQNVIERAVIVSDGERLAVDARWMGGRSTQSPESKQPLGDALVARERERAMIEAALAETKGRVSGPSGAAAKLGIPRSTLESKIRSLGLNKHRFKTN